MGLIIPDADDLAAYAPPPEPGLALPKNADTHDMFQTVARSGFHAIELPSDKGCMADPERLIGMAMQRMRAHMRDTGLSFSALADHLTIGTRARNQRTEARHRIESLIETAQRLECPLITVQCADIFSEAIPDAATATATDAARYALDTLHDVAQALGQSGVKLAMGGSADSFLLNAEAREILIRDKPEEVGLSLADGQHLGAAAVRTLAQGTLAAHVGLQRLPSQSLQFTDEDAARELVTSLTEGGYAGRLTVTAKGMSLDADTLARLYETVVRLSL